MDAILKNIDSQEINTFENIFVEKVLLLNFDVVSRLNQKYLLYHYDKNYKRVGFKKTFKHMLK